jgi:hypothetical protein
MTDLAPFITNDPKELVVIGSHKGILWFAILMTVPCIGVLTDSYDNWKKFISGSPVGAIFLLSIFYGGALFGWIKVFDKRIKFIINRDGIWYSKTQFVSWDNIESLSFEEQKTAKAGTFYLLKLKTKNRSKPYKIDITFFDKSYNQIQTAINENAIKNSVEDLGLETL